MSFVGLQTVADSANRLYHLAESAELLAQRAYVHINRARLAAVVSAPDFLHQLVARECRARVRKKEFEKLKFFVCQNYLFAAAAVDMSGSGYLESIKTDRFRLSLISADGKVIYDTREDADTLANHADREEIKEALETGKGYSTRYSSTLLQKTTYIAKKLADGSVLRISSSRETIGVLVFEAMQPILIVIVAALIISAVIAARLSKKIVEPLNSLDLEHPLENKTYDEIAPLLSRINRQHEQIKEQIKALQKKTDEFTQITDNMKEGLVLLDNDGKILSINPAACRLFEADEECIGKDFVSIDRSCEISAAIKRAEESGHSETRTKYSGRIYQFDISRIESDGSARRRHYLYLCQPVRTRGYILSRCRRGCISLRRAVLKRRKHMLRFRRR